MPSSLLPPVSCLFARASALCHYDICDPYLLCGTPPFFPVAFLIIKKKGRSEESQWSNSNNNNYNSLLIPECFPCARPSVVIESL